MLLDALAAKGGPLWLPSKFASACDSRLILRFSGKNPHTLCCSRRFLRLFSSGGNQVRIVWLKGDPVTVVGRGRFLAVIYHETSPLPDGTQKLGYTLFDAESSRVITSGSVSSISSGSQLEWAGFNDDGTLVVMDSDGMISMLVTSASIGDVSAYSWDWSPMLDTVGLRKSADDKFWPITVHNGKLICVPLKGGNEYPDAGRRPVTAALSFRMPLARSLIEKRHVALTRSVVVISLLVCSQLACYLPL